MKQFCCGDVVPGCTARFDGATNEDILTAVAAHAKKDHGLHEVPVAVVSQVIAKIQDIPSV